MKQKDTIYIGSRASKLALIQTNIVKDHILNNSQIKNVEIIPIITKGDKILDKNLYDVGGKGLFTEELEHMLNKGEIDFAVHSMKDMPPILTPGTKIAAILEREDARDVLISNLGNSISSLPKNAKIGTSSPRRSAQLLNLRPDFNIVLLRGNVPTRIDKLLKEECDATILALAGLKRLNLFDQNFMYPLNNTEMLSAVAQGAIGIQINENNKFAENIASKLNHNLSAICVNAERNFLNHFTTISCKTPIAAFAEFIDDLTINFTGLIASLDGTKIFRQSKTSSIVDIHNVSLNIAKNLIAESGGKLFV